MSPSTRLYVVAPTDSEAEALRASVGAEARVVSGLQALEASSDLEPGVVVVDEGVEATAVESFLRAASNGAEDWVLLRVQPGGAEDGVAVAPLSLGPSLPLGDALRKVRSPDEAGPLLDLGTVLSVVARARHDINNPLTSAMTETQLLLMDVEDQEIRSILEGIQTQLERIRDLVRGLTALKR